MMVERLHRLLRTCSKRISVDILQRACQLMRIRHLGVYGWIVLTREFTGLPDTTLLPAAAGSAPPSRPERLCVQKSAEHILGSRRVVHSSFLLKVDMRDSRGSNGQ